jgi:DNA-binding MarR family transcriptional regulator
MEAPVATTATAPFTNMPNWLMTQTAQHAHRLMADGMAAVGARGYHYRTLACLDEVGAASQADLGRRSGIHLSELVATINELVDQQLVERAPDPADRRRNIITITPAGRRRLRRLDEQLTQAQEEPLASRYPDERDQLTRLLRRVFDHHTDAGTV